MDGIQFTGAPAGALAAAAGDGAARGRHAAPRSKGRLRGIGTAPMHLVAGLARAVSPVEPLPRRRALPVAATAAEPRPASAALAFAPETGEYVEHVISSGETVSDVAERFGVSTAALLALNGLGWRSPLADGDVLLVRRAARRGPGGVPTDINRHCVGAGEDIRAIARRHGVSTAAVLLANGLSRGSAIRPGQMLVIPATLTRRGDAVQLEGRMRENAAVLVAVGRELRVPDDGIVVALVAAMAASCLFNLDADAEGAVGLFQLRPGTAWGSAEDLLEPDRAARAFYLGGPGVRGLLATPGWTMQDVADVACAVRGGPSVSAYEKWEAPARRWLADLDRDTP